MSTTAWCPVSAARGQPVGRRTVAALLVDAGGVGEGPFFFCPDPACDVVYFDTDGRETYGKARLNVRVGLKETDDPIPVCYCFDVTVARLRDEIELAGSTNTPAWIKAKVAAGECACETKNPQGSCCLGDVNRAVRAIQETRRGEDR